MKISNHPHSEYGRRVIIHSDEDITRVPLFQVKGHLDRLEPEIKGLKKVYEEGGYLSAYGSINCCTDESLRKRVWELVAKLKVYKPKMFILIGIGGSNLGTMAIYEALCGLLPSQEIELYCADTVDPDYNGQLLKKARVILAAGHKIIINVVSKSGSTTETIANFILFKSLLQEYHPDSYHEYIVATTDEGSNLWSIAEQEQYHRLSVPRLVGGRYSVFSAVGLFPLACMGIDIDAIHEGARNAVQACLTKGEHNPAAISASILCEQYGKGNIIHDLFIFAKQLESVGKWYRQLVGESLGKENKEGVRIGMMPTVSIGTIDLHSVGQLYFGGPSVRFTTFITVDQWAEDEKIPMDKQCEKLVANVCGKTVSCIMAAIRDGVQKAYKESALPYQHIVLPAITPHIIGYLLQLQMIETIYLGYLFQVNPFNQPQVEQYKEITRKILANG